MRCALYGRVSGVSHIGAHVPEAVYEHVRPNELFLRIRMTHACVTRTHVACTVVVYAFAREVLHAASPFAKVWRTQHNDNNNNYPNTTLSSRPADRYFVVSRLRGVPRELKTTISESRRHFKPSILRNGLLIISWSRFHAYRWYTKTCRKINDKLILTNSGFRYLRNTIVSRDFQRTFSNVFRFSNFIFPN